MSTNTGTTGPNSPAGSSTVSRAVGPHQRRGGPPLPTPALSYAVIAIAGAITYPAIRPADDATSVLTTLQQHHTVATVSALLLMAAAAPLAVWTASVSHRLRRLTPGVAAPFITMVGGLLAAGSLLASGLTAWTATQASGLGDAALVRALSTLSFGFGGAGFALGSALLLAGVAVPGLILRLVPRWLTVAGLVIAAVGVVSILSLLTPALGVLLPVIRFGGMLFLVVISIALPIARRSHHRPSSLSRSAENP